MMSNKPVLFLTLLLALQLVAGCVSADEAAVRSSVVECFQAAKRGDIELALEYMSADLPMAILAREGGEEALAGLSARARTILEGAELTIQRVEIQGALAFADIETVRGEKRIPQKLTLIKSGDHWLLSDLPLVELETVTLEN